MVEDWLSQLQEKGAFMPSPVSESEVSQAERELELEIPEDYKKFLKSTDGLQYEGLFFYGIETLPPDNMGQVFYGLVIQNDQWHQRIPEEYLIIGHDTGGLVYAYDYDKSEYIQMDPETRDVFETYSCLKSIAETT